jgi:acetyl-CoA carboxylase biotin carboxyl carrier protein
MGLTHEDVERILRLIDESGYEEIRIEYGEFKLHVRRHGAEPQLGREVAPRAISAPASAASAATPAVGVQASPGPAAPSTPEKALQLPPNAVVLRAPMLGTFYRSPSPGAPPYVEVGAEVRSDTTVCLIEVMKLFNSLKAGADGRVLQILVENGAMVEYDQPLIVIEPKAKG